MTLYEIVEVAPLPRVNPHRTLKVALFRAPALDAVNGFVHRYAGALSLSYFAGCLLFPVVIFAPPPAGRALAVLEAALELPGYANVALALRVDMIRLVVRTYDYWFLTAMTLIFLIACGWIITDLRFALICTRWFGFQVPILIDANFHQVRMLVYAVTLNIALLTLVMAAMTFDAMAGTHNPAWRLSPRRAITVREILLNATVTMTILLIRILYRKRALVRRTVARIGASSTTTTVQCVTLRCTIKLRALGEQQLSRSFVIAAAAATTTTATTAVVPVAEDTSEDPMTHAWRTHRRLAISHSSTRVSLTSTPDVQLRRVIDDRLIDSEAVLVPGLLALPWTTGHLLLLYAVGTTGLALTTLALLPQAESLPGWLPVVAAIATAAFCGLFAGVSHRDLGWRLLRSFDVVFLSIQITLADAFICDMLRWRPANSLGVACSWMWVHWVLMLDALTPVVRHRLGLRVRLCAGVVLGLYIWGQVAFVLFGIVWGHWDLQERELFELRLFGGRYDVQVVPFVATRLATVVVWNARLLWRLYDRRDPNQLLMLRGLVEFDHIQQRRPRGVSSSGGLSPGKARDTLHGSDTRGGSG